MGEDLICFEDKFLTKDEDLILETIEGEQLERDEDCEVEADGVPHTKRKKKMPQKPSMSAKRSSTLTEEPEDVYDGPADCCDELRQKLMGNSQKAQQTPRKSKHDDDDNDVADPQSVYQEPDDETMQEDFISPEVQPTVDGEFSGPECWNNIIGLPEDEEGYDDDEDNYLDE